MFINRKVITFAWHDLDFFYSIFLSRDAEYWEPD